MIVCHASNTKREPSQGKTRKRFLKDTRGVAAIEFGIIAAPLAALIVAILQTSLVFFAQQTLETAAEKSARQLLTGQAQKNNMTAAQFKTLVCTKIPVFMTCSNVMVDVQQYDQFSSVTTSAPALTYSNGQVSNTWKFTPGGAGTINVVQVMYIWSVSKGPLGFDLSTMSTGDRLLIATSTFKTEPYT